jgi:hypothetical protein
MRIKCTVTVIAREKVDAVIEEMDRWEELTRSTDFPQTTPA